MNLRPFQIDSMPFGHQTKDGHYTGTQRRGHQICRRKRLPFSAIIGGSIGAELLPAGAVTRFTTKLTGVSDIDFNSHLRPTLFVGVLYLKKLNRG